MEEHKKEKNVKNIKPPLGLIPKNIYERNCIINRFNDVCGAITRYYEAGLRIKVEWIEEYNDFIDMMNKEQ